MNQSEKEQYFLVQTYDPDTLINLVKKVQGWEIKGTRANSHRTRLIVTDTTGKERTFRLSPGTGCWRFEGCYDRFKDNEGVV